MYFTVRGRFVPNEGGVAGYVDRIWCKNAAKWGMQTVEMNFKTRSSPIRVCGACNVLYSKDGQMPCFFRDK
ncbi:DUF6783 domain-containing protein [Lachnospiraceae bacterium JLR.KK009]